MQVRLFSLTEGGHIIYMSPKYQRIFRGSHFIFRDGHELTFFQNIFSDVVSLFLETDTN